MDTDTDDRAAPAPDIAPEAITGRAGFVEVPPYGEYSASSGTSVCMARSR